jgi:hypothetical protein
MRSRDSSTVNIKVHLLIRAGTTVVGHGNVLPGRGVNGRAVRHVDGESARGILDEPLQISGRVREKVVAG